MVEVVVQQMVRVGGGLVRGRGQRVALRRGVPLQHGRGAAQRPEPHHQRPVRVRPDAHARPQRLALCNTQLLVRSHIIIPILQHARPLQ